MKKILAMVALIGLLAVPAFAGDAVDKGTLWITGQVDVSSGDNMELLLMGVPAVDVTSVSLNAIGNYFIIDKLAVGGELGVMMISNGGSLTAYNVGANILYAFDLNKNIYPFVTATVGMLGASNGASDSWVYAKGGGGVNWAVKDNIGVRADLLYKWVNTEGEAATCISLSGGLVGIFDL